MFKSTDLELKIKVKAVRMIVSWIFYRLNVQCLKYVPVEVSGVLQPPALLPAPSAFPPTFLRKIGQSDVFCSHIHI